MKKPRSRTWWMVATGLTVVLIALLAARLYLDIWLLGYVNNVLAHIDGYQGSVESINIDLYRGAYRINKLVLNKKEGTIPTPFLAIDETDLSLQWSALVHGRIVSSASLTDPTINFAVRESVQQTGANIDWTKPIKDLMPIDINSVRVKDGRISYQDFASTPQVNIFVHHLDGVVRNLRNVTDGDHPLPSTVDFTGSSIGNGKLALKGRMNILKPVPDMDLLMALENVKLPALNSYSEAYAAFDFKSGNFSLYSQLTVKDSEVGGYVKPIATDVAVDVLKSANPLEIAWDTVVAAILEVFTNHSKNQFATKIPLEGKLGNIGTDMWSTLGGILRNAFVAAMSKGFDPTGDHEVAKPDVNDAVKP